MTEFTPFLSTLGGVLIGLSAVILMMFTAFTVFVVRHFIRNCSHPCAS